MEANKDLCDKMVSLLLKGDHFASQKATEEMLAQGMNMETIYEDVFRQSLYRIGKLWEEHRVSVAQEHMATAIIENLMSSMLDSSALGDQKSINVLMVTLSCEHHRVGINMISDILAKRGCEVHWSTSDQIELEAFSVKLKEGYYDLIGVSLALRSNLDILQQTLDFIRKFSPSCKIVAGGQALQKVDFNLKMESPVELVRNIREFEEVLAGMGL